MKRILFYHLIKTLTVLILFLFSGISLKAQDIHFSQFYASPLTLNPAMISYFEGGYRVGINYKNQWKSVTTPFVTEAGYFDMKWNNRLTRNNNWFGLGASIYSDKAGSGGLSNTRGMLGISYHKTLDKFKTTYVSVGFMGGVVQKSIISSKLSFGNQWDGIGFNNSLLSGENFANDNFIYFDMTTGLLFSFKPSDKSSVYLGGSLNHITKPKESFLETSNSKKMRYVIHIGGSYDFSRKFSAEPGVFATFQSDAKEIIAGSNFVFSFLGGGAYAGLWYRTSGDIMPLVGFVFNKFRVLINYDYNISALHPATNAKGGAEISAVYIIPEKNPLDSRNKKFKCPTY